MNPRFPFAQMRYPARLTTDRPQELVTRTATYWCFCTCWPIYNVAHSPSEHPARTRRRRRHPRGCAYGEGPRTQRAPGKARSVLRAVRRAIDYDLVSVGERNEKSPETEVPLLVRRLVPLLSKHLAERLPEPLASEHHYALAPSETEETPRVEHDSSREPTNNSLRHQATRRLIVDRSHASWVA